MSRFYSVVLLENKWDHALICRT